MAAGTLSSVEAVMRLGIAAKNSADQAAILSVHGDDEKKKRLDSAHTDGHHLAKTLHPNLDANVYRSAADILPVKDCLDNTDKDNDHMLQIQFDFWTGSCSVKNTESFVQMKMKLDEYRRRNEELEKCIHSGGDYYSIRPSQIMGSRELKLLDSKVETSGYKWSEDQIKQLYEIADRQEALAKFHRCRANCLAIFTWIFKFITIVFGTVLVPGGYLITQANSCHVSQTIIDAYWFVVTTTGITIAVLLYWKPGELSDLRYAESTRRMDLARQIKLLITWEPHNESASDYFHRVLHLINFWTNNPPVVHKVSSVNDQSS